MVNDSMAMSGGSSGRFEDPNPKFYRLARKKDGSIILQGAYVWHGGNGYGHEWREIPIVELEE